MCVCRSQTEGAGPGKHAHLQKCPPSRRELKLHKARELRVGGEEAEEGEEGEEAEYKVGGAKEEGVKGRKEGVEASKDQEAKVVTKEEVGGATRIAMTDTKVTKATKGTINYTTHSIRTKLKMSLFV